MPTVPVEPHQARDMAESFGSDAERYDRTRPSYPQAMVARIIAESPGLDLLDVGVGTGIAARQFRAAGCRVLGVDVDPRMAERARHHGLDVEVAAFEAWEAAGRTFDIVTAAQTWHWIDPVTGATKAASVLRPGGRFAAFWNAAQPPDDIAQAFADVFTRVLPGAPLNPWAKRTSDGYGPLVARALPGIGAAGLFAEPEQWTYAWEQAYERDAWLEQMRTSGIAGKIPPDVFEQLIAGIGEIIDAAGGAFTAQYTTVALTATLRHMM